MSNSDPVNKTRRNMLAAALAAGATAPAMAKLITTNSAGTIMAGSLLPQPKQLFQDAYWNPLIGGKIYTYAAGTLTPKTTYQDAALTIANPNPTVPNSCGEVLMYGDEFYHIILKDKQGNTIWDRDNIGVLDLTKPTGSENIGNGGETVAQSFDALQLPDYAALQKYVGPRRCVYVTGYSALAPFLGIAGMFVADPSDTTSTTNGGTLFVASNGMRWKRQYSGGVDVRWWGAKFDYTGPGTGTDDTGAIQACVNYAQPLQKTILFPEGVAKITTPILVTFSLFGINIRGQGFMKSRINYASILPATSSAIQITGHSGALCGAVIEDVGFDGNPLSTGILILGQCGQRIRNCQFSANAIGIVVRNSVTGQFSEYCIAENCDFTSACASAIWYSVQGSGDVSFHGSGMRGCTINTPNVDGFRCVIVDPTALPYNAPMDIQVWGHATGDIISLPLYSGLNRPYFVGVITIEAFSPLLKLCMSPDGREVPLVGRVASVNTNFTMGTMFVVDAVITNSSGTQQTIGARVAKRQNLTAGANIITNIPSCIYQGAVEYTLEITAPNYNYRYKVGTFGRVGDGVVQVLATYATFNSAGYGTPTFSIDATTGQLVITNAAFPTSGVMVNVSAEQVGQSIYDEFFE